MGCFQPHHVQFVCGLGMHMQITGKLAYLTGERVGDRGLGGQDDKKDASRPSHKQQAHAEHALHRHTL